MASGHLAYSSSLVPNPQETSSLMMKSRIKGRSMGLPAPMLSLVPLAGLEPAFWRLGDVSV